MGKLHIYAHFNGFYIELARLIQEEVFFLLQSFFNLCLFILVSFLMRYKANSYCMHLIVPVGLIIMRCFFNSFRASLLPARLEVLCFSCSSNTHHALQVQKTDRASRWRNLTQSFSWCLGSKFEDTVFCLFCILVASFWFFLKISFLTDYLFV